MTAALDPGEQHTRFITWAESHGVQINGVAPARFLGRGMGIVAARDIKKGDTLVSVPNTSLVHIALPSIRDFAFPTHTTVHGRLAASLALWYTGTPSPTDYTPWQSVWPTPSDFHSTMPLYYPPSLRSLLPPPATPLLTTQLANLEKDWSDLSPHLPPSSTITKDVYTYTWLIVNTRTFYWDYPDLPNSHPRLPRKRRGELTANDCYAMCPFMDYFNHSDEGCTPQHTREGYSVTADREYSAGEEVFVSYGPHTNDFLLVEYGFILDTGKNKNDGILLDEMLIPLLTKEQEGALREDGFWGNWTLSEGLEGCVCHRTQAVLRLLVLDARRYAAFVKGDDDGARDQARLNRYLAGVLTKYSRRVMDVIEEVELVQTEKGEQNDEDKGSNSKGTSSSEPKEEALARPEQKDMLLKRWLQIQSLVNAAITKLGS
ncbi:Nn.00g038790.m01.CDS01 [Neocucurbitaria sp. VM-36]